MNNLMDISQMDGSTEQDEPGHSTASVTPSWKLSFLDKMEDSADSEQVSHKSLEWDDASILVNLSDPLDSTRLFQETTDDDEVFSPQLEIPQSPISPFQRVTRRLVRTGEYSVRSSLSSDGTTVHFVRNSTLRRPFQKVTFHEDDIQEIVNLETGPGGTRSLPPPEL